MSCTTAIHGSEKLLRLFDCLSIEKWRRDVKTNVVTRLACEGAGTRAGPRSRGGRGERVDGNTRQEFARKRKGRQRRRLVYFGGRTIKHD